MFSNDPLSEVKKPESVAASVDVTRFFNVPDGETRILQWACPDLSALYRVGADAAELRKRFPLWEVQLAIDVATLAACHEGPRLGGLAPALFYAGLANSGNQPLWTYLLNRYSQEFPHLRPSEMPFFDELLDACAEMYNRHPDELSHLSATVIEELLRAHARKVARRSAFS